MERRKTIGHSSLYFWLFSVGFRFIECRLELAIGKKSKSGFGVKGQVWIWRCSSLECVNTSSSLGIGSLPSFTGNVVCLCSSTHRSDSSWLRRNARTMDNLASRLIMQNPTQNLHPTPTNSPISPETRCVRALNFTHWTPSRSARFPFSPETWCGKERLLSASRGNPSSQFPLGCSFTSAAVSSITLFHISFAHLYFTGNSVWVSAVFSPSTIFTHFPNSIIECVRVTNLNEKFVRLVSVTNVLQGIPTSESIIFFEKPL